MFHPCVSSLFFSGFFVTLACCTVLGIALIVADSGSHDATNDSGSNSNNKPTNGIKHGDSIYDLNTHETFNVLSVDDNRGDVVRIKRNGTDKILYRSSDKLFSDNDGNWYSR